MVGPVPLREQKARNGRLAAPTALPGSTDMIVASVAQGGANDS